VPRIFNKNRISFYLLCGVVLATFFYLVPLLFSPVKNLSVSIVSYPVRVFSDISNYFKSRTALVKDNRALRESLTELSLRLNDFNCLHEENKRLRSLLAFKDKTGIETIPAEIIARNPNDWLASFVIDKGSNNDIKKGSAVCVVQGLLGRVNEVSERTSSVMLMAHPRFRVGGMIKNTQFHGIIIGEGDGFARMLYLPIKATIHEGSVVVTSGYSRIFPKGIPIGKVVRVEKSKTGLYKDAIVKPSADPFSQDEVLCVK